MCSNGQKITYLTVARMGLDPMLIDLQHPSTNHIEFEIGVKNLQKKHKKKKLRSKFGRICVKAVLIRADPDPVFLKVGSGSGSTTPGSATMV